MKTLADGSAENAEPIAAKTIRFERLGKSEQAPTPKKKTNSKRGSSYLLTTVRQRPLAARAEISDEDQNPVYWKGYN